MAAGCPSRLQPTYEGRVADKELCSTLLLVWRNRASQEWHAGKRVYRWNCRLYFCLAGCCDSRGRGGWLYLLRPLTLLSVVATDVYCKLTPNVSSEKIWVWTVMDFAEGELKNEQFALKFGQVERKSLSPLSAVWYSLACLLPCLSSSVGRAVKARAACAGNETPCQQTGGTS